MNTYVDIFNSSFHVETIGILVEVAVLLVRQVNHFTDLRVVAPGGGRKPDLLGLSVVCDDKLHS